MTLGIRALAKATRDVAADSLARFVVRHPATERYFLAAGRAIGDAPVVRLVHRRSCETMSACLRQQNRMHRRIRVHDVEVMLDVTEFTTNALFYKGREYEPQTTRALLDLLRPGDIFVDVGANHGYCTVLAAARVGVGGRAFAFEPNPAVLRQLETHLALNGIQDRVTISPTALTDEARATAMLFVSRHDANSGLSSLTPSDVALRSGDLSHESTIMVRTDTFDAWKERAGVHGIRLVKIDVEGAESLVLAGMARTLAADPPQHIICETAWDSPAFHQLVAAGYAPSRLEAEYNGWGNVLFTRDA